MITRNGLSNVAIIMAVICCSLITSEFVFAQKSWQEVGESQLENLTIPLNKSKLLEFPSDIKNVSVGNPEIADIVVFDSNKVYVLGRSIGATNVLIIDQDDEVLASINLKVDIDLNSVKKNMYELMPGESINVHSSKGSIVLSGQVTSISKSNAAVELARNYLPVDSGDDIKVINLLTIGGAQQVMLEVKVAEISRQVMKRLDIDFNVIRPGEDIAIGAVSGGAGFPDATIAGTDGRIPVFPFRPSPPIFTPIGPVVDEFMPTDLSIQDQGAFLSFINDNVLFNAVIDIAKENGLAKILAEPTLTTQTGQRAKFISGGEVPIPVPNEDGITISFKEFGVGLEFLPVVLSSNRINLDLNLTVSQLTDAFNVVVGTAANPLFVPSLTKRSINTTVELADGQTLGIAGLINEDLRETVNKFPGLANIPILGAMFRSQEFVKGQSELVIFVTPYFAKPIDKDKIKLPTDYFIEPNDHEFYLLGRIEAIDPDDVEYQEYMTRYLLREPSLRKTEPVDIRTGHEL